MVFIYSTSSLLNILTSQTSLLKDELIFSSNFLVTQIKWAIVVPTLVTIYKLDLLIFLCQQQNQEDLDLWEEKFGTFVDVKVNGKIEIGTVLKQIFPKWLNVCTQKSLELWHLNK